MSNGNDRVRKSTIHCCLLFFIYTGGAVCYPLPLCGWSRYTKCMYAHLNDLFVEFVRVRFKSLELLGGYMGFAWQFGNIYTSSRTYSSTALGVSNTESQRYAAAHLGSSRIRETTKLPRKKCSKTKKADEVRDTEKYTYSLEIRAKKGRSPLARPRVALLGRRVPYIHGLVWPGSSWAPPSLSFPLLRCRRCTPIRRSPTQWSPHIRISEGSLGLPARLLQFFLCVLSVD